MAKKVLLIGAFNSKGPEYAFVRDVVLANGLEVITVNTCVWGTTNLFPVDIEAVEVAQAGPPALHDADLTSRPPDVGKQGRFHEFHEFGRIS